MFIVFLCLIVGPIVASKFLKGLPKLPMDLLQPTGQNNNDTTGQTTGAGMNFGLNGAAGTGGAAATSAAATSGS